VDTREGPCPILVLGSFSISADELIFRSGIDYGVNDAYVRVVILTWLKLLCDSPLDPAKPIRVFKSFLRKLTEHPLVEVVAEFSKLAHSLVSEDFGSGSEASIRPYLKDFERLPVYREYLEYQRTGSPELLRYLLTFLRFAKKCAYVDEQFNAIAFRDWQGVEEKLRGLSFDKDELTSLRNAVTTLLQPLSDTLFLGRFGPGRVSERGVEHVWEKLSNLVLDEKVRRTFRSTRFGLDGVDGISDFPTQDGPGFRFSRLKFVPKDLSKSRSICMEPNGFMFAQQEVKRWVYESISRSTISRFVHLDDQKHNQAAAVHGSRFLSSDTLDLSSASDSVHVDLVKGLFPKQWLYYLLGTRTSEVIDPEGDIVQVTKFAPMGSALCFPVQCIVFTAICLQSYVAYVRGVASGSVVFTEEDYRSLIKDHLHRSRGPGTPYTRRLEPPLVFGDDIICDSRITGDVISALTRLGFKVNTDKSFKGSQTFRESCGVFASQGEDVTPYHYKLPFFGRYGTLTTSLYAAMIDAINNMKRLGYYQTSMFMRHVLELKMTARTGRLPEKLPNEMGKPPWWNAGHCGLPFTEDPNGFGILVKHKHHVPSRFLRYYANWQVDGEMVLGIVARVPKGTSRPDNLDEYAYALWQRSKIRGIASPNERSSRIRPQETRFAAIWSPLR
jgi:hypothetical protein